MNLRASVSATIIASVILACSGSPESAAPASGALIGPADDPARAVQASYLAGGVDYDAIPVERIVQMWHQPNTDGRGFYFDAQNPFGERTPMLVTDERTDGPDPMIRVLLPIRPNEA